MKNKKVCFECVKDTGGCCDEVELSIHKDELKVFKDRFDNFTTPKGHTLEVHDDDTKVFLYSSKKDRCMFLNEEDKCSIYDERPLICRAYPVMWETKRNLMQFIADFACPLAHMVTTREMYSWTKTQKNKKMIKLMGELDFDSSLPQYVNLTVITEEVDPPELLSSDIDR